MDKRHLSEADAEKVLDETWDCRISEVVNQVVGTHCMIPRTQPHRPHPTFRHRTPRPTGCQPEPHRRHSTR